MVDVRLGVVGFGLRRSLAEAAHQPGGGSIVAGVCDLDPAVRAAEADRFDAAVVTADYRDFLTSGDIDAVVVNTPDDTHFRLVLDALRAGTPVYVEKPLGITIAECDEMLRTAAETGTKLYAGHNMRHMGVVTLMREIVRRGEIGRPRAIWVRHFVGHGGDYYFKDWHADRRRTTGLLLQKGAHDIDVVHWLADAYTRTVSAVGELAVYGDLPRREPGAPKTASWLAPAENWPPLAQRDLNDVVDVEDISMVNMRLDNGVLASYQQCHFTPDYWRNYTVIGDAGRLENFGDEAGAAVRVWNAKRSGYRAEPDAEYFVPDAGGTHGGADALITREFARFVRDGGRCETSPVAARMTVAAGVRATESLRGGGIPLEVPPLSEELVEYFDNGQPTRT